MKSQWSSPLVAHLVQEAGEEGVRRVVIEERPFLHQDDLDVLTEHRVFTQQLHAGFSQDSLKRPKTLNGLFGVCSAMT